MRPTDLDVNILRAFVTVFETGGFTATGARLGCTQAAVSIQIKRLEELLRCRVFDRSSRSLQLTRDGEALLGYARQILRLNDETVEYFSEPEREGEIRLGIAEYFVPQQLSLILSRFVRAYPRVHLEVKVGMNVDLFDALGRGEIDLAIARRDDRHREEGCLVRREQLCWAVAPGFGSVAGISLPLCASPPPCFFRSRAAAVLDDANRPWRVIYTSQSIMGIIAAVRAGLGVAVLPESALANCLTTVTSEDELPNLGEIELAIFDRREGRSRLTSTFVRFIEESLRNLSSPN